MIGLRRSPQRAVAHRLARVAQTFLAVASLTAASYTTLHGQTGLLVVVHGADSAWNARVAQTVAQVSWPDGPVAIAYLMGSAATTSGWDSAVTRLAAGGAERIVAVPFMMSSFGGHYRQIRYYAGELDSLPESFLNRTQPSLVPPPLAMRVTTALDAAPELGRALLARWMELDVASLDAPLLVVAHGPSADDEAVTWHDNLERVLRWLPQRIHDRGVRVAQLRDDAAPEVRAAAVSAMRDTVMALAERNGDSVTVLPAFISEGKITDVKIPGDLENLPVRYRRTPLAPLPELARWIERMGRDAMRGGS